MNLVLKLVTLVVILNSVNARGIYEEFKYVLPITQECKNTIQDVYFEEKDSVNLSDWSRIYLEHRKISKSKLDLDVTEYCFHQIDLNKNEIIELDEFKKEYLDRIVGSLFDVGDNVVCECDCCECCQCNEDPKSQGPQGWILRDSVRQPRHAGEVAATKDVGIFFDRF